MSDIGTSNSVKVMEPARDNTKFAGIREGGGGVGVAALANVLEHGLAPLVIKMGEELWGKTSQGGVVLDM